MTRRAEGPHITALLCAMFMLVSAAAGMAEGAKVRTCPTTLDDGRKLQRQDLSARQCFYAPPPRGLEWYSPAELRRVAAARERMERVR